MERLKVYKGKKGFAKFSIVFGSIFCFFGIGQLIHSLVNKTSVEWTSFTFTLQGILFIFFGYKILQAGKYFIEWNDVQMNYLLPDIDSIETIVFAEVKGVQIDLFEIHVDLRESNRVINLANLEFEHIKSLKQKFKEIKKAAEHNQPE